MNGDMETEEGRQIEEALNLYREFRNTTQTAGWKIMLQLLVERPSRVALDSIDNSDAKEPRPTAYWKGRLDESRWLLQQLATIQEQGEELIAAKAEKRAAEDEAVKAFLGHGSRGGMA